MGSRESNNGYGVIVSLWSRCGEHSVKQERKDQLQFATDIGKVSHVFQKHSAAFSISDTHVNVVLAITSMLVYSG